MHVRCAAGREFLYLLVCQSVSLKTLHVRMKEHEKKGFAVARFLESHPCVEKVFFPGKCFLVRIFELLGGSVLIVSFNSGTLNDKRLFFICPE